MADKGKKKKQGKQGSKVSQAENKERHFRSFLYMLPVEADVKQLAEVLDFLGREQIEIWTEVNLLELTLTNGTLTFEDMMAEMERPEDAALLREMEIKQVYACDYEAADALEVRHIMSALTEQLGGLLASDTEDFQPFLKLEEL